MRFYVFRCAPLHGVGPRLVVDRAFGYRAVAVFETAQAVDGEARAVALAARLNADHAPGHNCYCGMCEGRKCSCEECEE